MVLIREGGHHHYTDACKIILVGLNKRFIVLSYQGANLVRTIKQRIATEI
jgi:hypothetical protein